MPEPTPEEARQALRAVLFPGFRRDIVSLGMVSDDVQVARGVVRVHLRPGSDKPEVVDELRRRVVGVLGRLPGVTRVEVHVARAEAGRGRDPAAERAALPGVRHVLAVASTKGGGGNWRTSIVDLLKLLDLDSSLEARKDLAAELGVHAGADGTAEQNIALSKAVWAKLAENGGQVPASLRN